MGTCIFGKSKNRIIKWVVFIILLAAIIVAICITVKLLDTPKSANISIDDATIIFNDITCNNYDSIFDNPILKKVKYLHDQYGITVTLYTFGEMGTYGIWQMPTSYKKEFHENSNWLKIGFHSPTEKNPEEEEITLDDFKTAFKRTESAISKFAGDDVIAHVLRLHYWYATEEMVEYLKSEGVTALLCSDGNETSYDLPEEQQEKMNYSRDGVVEYDLIYYKTDIRLENEADIIDTLQNRKKDHVIVIFTHAEAFEDNYGKLQRAVEWLYENHYTFSSLEKIVN